MRGSADLRNRLARRRPLPARAPARAPTRAWGVASAAAAVGSAVGTDVEQRVGKRGRALGSQHGTWEWLSATIAGHGLVSRVGRTGAGTIAFACRWLLGGSHESWTWSVCYYAGGTNVRMGALDEGSVAGAELPLDRLDTDS